MTIISVGGIGWEEGWGICMWFSSVDMNKKMLDLPCSSDWIFD